MSENQLIREKKGHIFFITLNRPKKRNALPFKMLTDISRMGPLAVGATKTQRRQGFYDFSFETLCLRG
jgi:hypothetical protein